MPHTIFLNGRRNAPMGLWARLILAFVLIALPAWPTAAQSTAVDELRAWLQRPTAERGDLAAQDFALRPLTRDEALETGQLLWGDRLERLRQERRAEWEAKRIELNGLEMKFDYRVFGEKPSSGRSLYLSMHGGGGAPARVNDQQWKNQIGLYQPEEGVYLAPRAPTNTWNLWHEPHIDDFFSRIIADAIALEDVDPNRVYLMGYSAGGDGVYQLAPRMADRWAAAAMMAGHPNNARPDGLRNIGFTLHMGGEDSAYNRNAIAAQWRDRLAELRREDPRGYAHDVVIHEGLPHWMNRRDAVAVPWMAQFSRQPYPDKVVWLQSGGTHHRFYWLAVDEANRKGGARIVATRAGQEINIESVQSIERLSVRFNDQMLDLDRPVVVRQGEQELFRGVPTRTIEMLGRSLDERPDPASLFSAEVVVELPR